MSTSDIEELTGAVTALAVAFSSLAHHLHYNGTLDRDVLVESLKARAREFEGQPGYATINALVNSLVVDDDNAGHPAWLQGVFDGGKDKE